MSAATAPRLTSKAPILGFSFAVAAAARLLGGTMGAINAAGDAVPASDAAGLKVRGVVTDTVDNTTGSAGDLHVELLAGTYLWENSTTHPLTKANVGSNCYVEDNQTVSSNGGTNSIVAGVVQSVTADGVWVTTPV